MKKILSIIFVMFFCANFVCAKSMFDADGNYTGNWKQMTHVQPKGSTAYKNSDYYTSTWKAEQNKRKNNADYRVTTSSNKNDVTPFRYNTANYTKVRQMKTGDGVYKMKCTDIGDASFCY